jgi:hypothetical protein
MRVIFILFSLFVLGSCSKGYEVRFTNYFIEKIDSVSMGSQAVFTSIAFQASTDYQAVPRGQYDIKIVSISKKRFTAQVFVPGNGTGKRTIQIDGIGQVSFLEDE